MIKLMVAILLGRMFVLLLALVTAGLTISSLLIILMNPVLSETCPTGIIGLCTPGTTEVIESETTIETQTDGTGTTTTETTTTTTTATIVENKDSGDVLKGSSGFVTTSKEGDMDYDWGGQGPASMHSNCPSDSISGTCAQITGSGSSTSAQGVPNMGTTFIQTVDVASLNVDRGGRTNYTIKLDKQDASDSAYMHITGKSGTSVLFTGTDILSAAGVATGYSVYDGGFDFGGSLTSLIIEVGGRDINLAIGPLFDDVTVNVLYNVVNTIVTQSITTIETFVALNLGGDSTIIDIAENIFENNNITENNGEIEIAPIDPPAAPVSYESVANEMEAEVTIPPIETSSSTSETTQQVEAEVNTEIEAEVVSEPAVKEKQLTTEKKAEKVAKAKQKAAKKILKKMGNKGRYDSNNQLKTLVVMSVLGDTKKFFSGQQKLPQIKGFFNNVRIPDAKISDNNYAAYFMFGGSDGAHDALTNLQYKRK
tara:strand:- start:159 stop:1604 length:1446 start_codon:yes stop_codon:yes gene_type:complete